MPTTPRQTRASRATAVSKRDFSSSFEAGFLMGAIPGLALVLVLLAIRWVDIERGRVRLSTGGALACTGLSAVEADLNEVENPVLLAVDAPTMK